MSWSTVALGEAVAFKGGGTPSRDNPAYWGGSIPWATVKDLNSGYALRTAQEFITEEGLQRSASNLISAGTVIIPTRMALGKAVMSEVDIAINQDLKAAIPVKELDPRYLLWFFIANSVRIEAMGKGATVKGVTLDQLRSLEIPLPPIPEQRRIAAILDKADALRAKRREAIAKLDQLLQSVFLEMFGDPVSNPKDWPGSTTLGDLLSLMQYGPRFYNEKYSPDGIRIVRITDLSASGDLDFDAMPRMHVDSGVEEKSALRPGDLVFARTGATVGKVALIKESDPPSIAGAYFIRMQFDDSVLPRYVFTALRAKSIQKLIAVKSRQAAQQNFSGPGLRQLPIPVPPLELQSRFACLAERIDHQKRNLQDNAEKQDDLFASLQHRAFTGTL